MPIKEWYWHSHLMINPSIHVTETVLDNRYKSILNAPSPMSSRNNSKNIALFSGFTLFLNRTYKFPSLHPQASQLLQRVLAYESSYDELQGWLGGEKARAASFAPPAITVEELKTQLREVEVRCRRASILSIVVRCVFLSPVSPKCPHVT